MYSVTDSQLSVLGGKAAPLCYHFYPDDWDGRPAKFVVTYYLPSVQTKVHGYGSTPEEAKEVFDRAINENQWSIEGAIEIE